MTDASFNLVVPLIWRLESYQAPPSIFLKSSWPFAAPVRVLLEAAVNVGCAAGAADTVARAFLLPKPALGREAAVRGMKRSEGALVEDFEEDA